MVDIADRALSTAINDPTTAVQVLNHLSDVLRLIGTTDFSRSRWRADDAIRTGLGSRLAAGRNTSCSE